MCLPHPRRLVCDALPGHDNVFVTTEQGGSFLEGTFELDVIEGTGIYRSFVGGHNHMVDNLHFLALGTPTNTASATSAIHKQQS